MKKTAKLSKTAKLAFIFVLILAVIPFVSKAYMHFVTRSRIYSVSTVPKCRVAMVLGCKVHKNGKLSAALASRCDKAIELYKAGKVDKLLMSGDNRFIRYNEPKHMCDYAIQHGVPAEDVVADFAGRRTYDSVYRAKHIFGLDKLVVVTQQYHMDRTLFLCKVVGIDACGVPANYTNDARSRVRELPACMGAIVDAYLWHPRPVMGEKERI